MLKFVILWGILKIKFLLINSGVLPATPATETLFYLVKYSVAELELFRKSKFSENYAISENVTAATE